MLPAANRRREH